METTVEKSSKQLKELIIINNDRYEGYKTAAKEVEDSNLKTIFDNYSHQSKQFSGELEHMLPNKRYTPDAGETKNSGKLYRVYMNVKAAITAKNKREILSSCEYGEDTIKKTYDDILESHDGMGESELSIIRKQRAELQKSHDKIKAMRDSA